MKHVTLVVSALAVSANLAAAQTPAASDPGNMGRFSRAIKARYDNIKRDIVEAADAVPESEYAFKPTPEVRSFGEIIGHIADSQNFYCGVAAGHNPQFSDTNEKGKATKADLVKGLKESVAGCDEAYGSLAPANVLGIEPAGKGDALRAMMLLDNIAHDNEHYGNIVTYMRLKGHVPPSTARAQKASGH